MILNQSLTEIAKIVGTIEIELSILTQFRACTCKRDIAVRLASSVYGYSHTVLGCETSWDSGSDRNQVMWLGDDSYSFERWAFWKE